MEIVTDNNTYSIEFDFQDIFLIDNNNNRKFYNTFRLSKDLQKTIKRWHNQYQENLLPTINFNKHQLKKYKQTNALCILLKPRQINTIMACLKIERNRREEPNSFDPDNLVSNFKKHYIYDKPKTGKSLIPLELSKYKINKLDNLPNADTNIVLCPKHLINQWKTLLRTLYNGKYVIIDTIEKLNKCLVYGPIQKRYNRYSLLNSKYHKKYKKNIIKSKIGNSNYINISEFNIIHTYNKTEPSFPLLLYSNKFINPYILENTDIILITPQIYHEFKNYFKRSDYNSISRLFVDSCFDNSILDYSTKDNEINIHHTYYITNNFNYLVHNNFKYHSYISKFIKDYHIKRMECKFINTDNYWKSHRVVKNKLDYMKYELENLIIFSHDSIPNEIYYLDTLAFYLTFRMNGQAISENIINLLKNEKYNDILHLFKLKTHTIKKLVCDFTKKNYSSSIIERIQTKDSDCPICLDKIDVPLLTNCCYNKLCLKCYIFSQKETQKCPCCRAKTALDNQYILETDKISNDISKSLTIPNLISSSKYKSRMDNLLDIISYISSKDKLSEAKFIIVINFLLIRNINEIEQIIMDFNKSINNYTSISSIGKYWNKELDNFNFTPKYNCLIMKHTNYTYLINSGYNFVNLKHVISYNFELENMHMPQIIKTHKNQSAINYFNISK